MKNKKTYFIILFHILLLSIIFGYLYVHNEDNVYVYDYIGYQLRYNHLSSLFKTDWLNAISYLITTIRTLDYNYFPILFLVPLYHVIGQSRL